MVLFAREKSRTAWWPSLKRRLRISRVILGTREKFISSLSFSSKVFPFKERPRNGLCQVLVFSQSENKNLDRFIDAARNLSIKLLVIGTLKEEQKQGYMNTKLTWRILSALQKRNSLLFIKEHTFCSSLRLKRALECLSSRHSSKVYQ